MAYTIKEIADLAGVTTRTIRYYDESGLLDPAQTGDNGYRYYDRDSLLRLQQILFFRELDVPLKEIRLMMGRPDFDLLSALDNQRSALRAKVQRLEKLIDTLDKTVASLKGDGTMSDQDVFDGFDESQYEDEVQERWGDSPKVAESQVKWSSYSKDQKEAIKAEGRRLTVRMVSEDPEASPDDPDIQAAVGEYHAYLNKYFYTSEISFLRGLADNWVQDPRFAINYERIREGGAAFVREAVHVYCDRNE
ncbi:MAG: MerR family transcriptional regulator [Anaerolineales bacterium]|nr:MAG: MerR family transcriptional regulator [Anaerolineales bacterium]